MTSTPSAQRLNVHVPPHPSVLDSIHLRNIQLPLPAAPDSWHRPGKPQPCTVSLKLSYSSAIAAAANDDVSLSLDYGKLYRRLEGDTRRVGSGHEGGALIGEHKGPGEDVRETAGIVAGCGLGLLDETAAGVRRMSHTHTGNVRSGRASAAPIDGTFGQCEVWLHLPKAILRADEGLKYRSVTVWGYRQDDEAATGPGSAAALDEAAVVTGTGDASHRRPVVLEEEFKIDGIRCYCILGVNSHERVEKQAVIVSLEFTGPGQLAWGSTVVDTFQEMTRVVAEVLSSRGSPLYFYLLYLAN